MTFLPIVERELRVAARQRPTYWMRLVAAALALAVWFIIAAFGKMSTAERATIIFGTINVLSLGFALLAGVFLTSDCLAEERREGTLGLLFLTDLKGHDVVLGKLASTSVHAIYGLLAVVPMMAIPLLMGGVTAGEFARSALVLLAALLLSLSAGMVVSAFSLDARVALVRTLAIVTGLSGLAPLLWWLIREVWVGTRPDFLLWFSPGYALRYAADELYRVRGGAGEFWITLSVTLGLSLLFLVIASLLLPRVWQQARNEAGSERRCVGTKPLLGAKPYHWLALRDQRMGRWAMWMLLGVLVVWLGFYLHSGPPLMGRAAFVFALFMAFGLHALLKTMIATEATRRLSEDRQSGALELLLVTPLPPEDIVAGQRAALLRQFRMPLAILTLLNLLLIVLVAHEIRNSTDEGIFLRMFFGGILALYTDAYVLGMVGMWSALTTKRHTRAVLKTIRLVLLPPWGAILLFWFIGITSQGISSDAVQVMVVLWFCLGLIVNAAVLQLARMRLANEFRELAAGQGGTAREGRS